MILLALGESESALSHARLFVTPWTIVHGILQARILEWVAFPFSRGSSQPRDQTQVSRIAGGFFTNWAMGDMLQYLKYLYWNHRLYTCKNSNCWELYKLQHLWWLLTSYRTNPLFLQHFKQIHQESDSSPPKGMFWKKYVSCSFVSDSLWPHGL